MAEKRMYSKKITDGDSFISLSSKAQALYFHLNQGADDDGFNDQMALAMYKSHADEDALGELLDKGFVIRFDSGVLVISHWLMHNTLRKDRYTPTSFSNEARHLGVKTNGMYTLDTADGCQTVAERLPNGCHSIDKVSKVKSSKEEDRIGEGSKDTTAPLPALDYTTINGVVRLTEDEVSALINTMGLDSFDKYTDKLARFIEDKSVDNIKSHYDEILKWWAEDGA